MWFCSQVPGMVPIYTDDGAAMCNWLKDISLRNICHVSNSALPSSYGFSGWRWRVRSRLPRSLHKCSSGFNFGNIAGQWRTLMPFKVKLVSAMPYASAHCSVWKKSCCLVDVAAIILLKHVEEFLLHSSWQLGYRSNWLNVTKDCN